MTLLNVIGWILILCPFFALFLYISITDSIKVAIAVFGMVALLSLVILSGVELAGIEQ